MIKYFLPSAALVAGSAAWDGHAGRVIRLKARANVIPAGRMGIEFLEKEATGALKLDHRPHLRMRWCGSECKRFAGEPNLSAFGKAILMDERCSQESGDCRFDS
jgi:hypothetical protein